MYTRSGNELTGGISQAFISNIRINDVKNELSNLREKDADKN